MADIRIAVIRLDKDAQPRAEIDSAIVADYREAMVGGAKFPGVVVFFDGQDHWLADGFHRVYAAKSLDKQTIEATIRNGSRRDAILFSVSANAVHGLRRTNADKRKAVLTLLTDPAWVKWSDRKIAQQAKITHPFVSNLRRELSGNGYQIDSGRTVERAGTVYQMDTSQIGKAGDDGQLSLPDATEPERPMPMPPPAPSPQPLPAPVPLTPATVPTPAPAPKVAMFNKQENANIEWAGWSWNPVTGCKTGCPYCYARDIAMHYQGHFDPTFHPDRMDAPINTKVPVPSADAPAWEKQAAHTVFTCSMSDLFGPWVPDEWINPILAAVRAAPQWTFIFLTKYPTRLATIDWPDNAWVGTTVDVQARVAAAEAAFNEVRASVKFLSCEPLRERLTFSDLSMFDWVIIGGQSDSSKETARQPEWAWVESLQSQARAADCKVYWKPNLTVRPREYPGG